MSNKRVFRSKPYDFHASITNSGISYNNKLEIELDGFRIPDIYGVLPSIDSSVFLHCDEIQVTIEPVYNRPRLKGKTATSCIFDEWSNLIPANLSSKEYKIKNIKKVIINPPATIIIDIFGNKTVVKHDGDGKESIALGVGMCMLKYILDSKTYHDIVDEIFDPEHTTRTTAERVSLIQAILISHLGRKTYEGPMMNLFIDATHDLEDRIKKQNKQNRKEIRKRRHEEVHDIWKNANEDVSNMWRNIEGSWIRGLVERRDR